MLILDKAILKKSKESYSLIRSFPFIFQTVCINTNFVRNFIENYNQSDAAILSRIENQKMLREVGEEFDRQEKYLYSHKVREKIALTKLNLWITSAKYDNYVDKGRQRKRD